MSEATNTLLGEIKLTGDLAGDGGAQVGSNPQLTHMAGLTAGQYNVANITVDSKGRITDIEGASSSQIAALIPDATTTVKGKVSIGDNIYTTPGATSGYQVVDFGGTLLTTTPLDHCSSAEYTLSVVVDGTTKTYTFSGGGLGSTVQSMLIAINVVANGFTVSLDSGDIKITSDEIGSSSTIDIISYGIFSCMSGFVDLNVAVDGLSSCEIYVKDASTTEAGVVQIGSGINVTDGLISVSVATLPPATETILGSVIVPTAGNIDVDVSGNISVPIATTSSVGVVQIGSGLTIDGSGVVSISGSLPIASDTVLGCVKEGTGVIIDVDGTLSVDVGTVPKATESSLGVIQVGNGLDVTVGGVLSINTTEITATDSAFGTVKSGTNVSISGGVLSIPDGTPTTKGVWRVQENTGLTVASGVLSGTQASAANFGVVKIGTNITATSGTISVPTATTSVKGVLRVPTGGPLVLTSGALSINDATTSTKGVVQIGTNVNVASGVISIPDATTLTKGVVQIGNGTGLTVSSGVLNGVLASGNSTLGVVRSADPDNISIVSGNINVGTNIPKLNANNVFTKSQTVQPINVSYVSSWTPDLSLSNTQTMTLTGSLMIQNPSNLVVGGVYTFILSQDAVGARPCAWGSYYKFPSGTSNSLSTESNAIDVISLIAKSSTEILVLINRGF